MTLDIIQVLGQRSIDGSAHLLNRYVKFIQHCSKTAFEGYTENHHIIPRSFTNDNRSGNLIKLSARHHYIAHLLLAKATNNPKMIKALHKMIYSVTGDVQRTYKITSRVYKYLRESHSKVVSEYSKNTVVARQIYTGEVKRIPSKLFHYYNGILYEALAKGRKDSAETRIKKQNAMSRPRKSYRKGLESRSIAAALYSYETPKGFALTSTHLRKLYPSFTANTLTIITGDAIITNKFASIHQEFKQYVGLTFKQYGLTKIKRKEIV